MDDHAVVHLDDQGVRIEELGRLPHEQIAGKGHEAQRILQSLGAVLGEERVDGIRCGEILPLDLIGVVLPGVADLVGNDLAVHILDRLPDNILYRIARHS